MCNEYQKRIARGPLTERFSEINIPIRWADAEPNRDLDEPIRPTDRATILRAADPGDPTAGLEGLEMRWWLTPAFHRGPLNAWRSMCTNARIETVDTAPTFREAYRRRRCLVPLTSFIEYSEPPGWKKGRPKTRHEISWADEDVRVFAGLWERSTPEDHPGGLESFAFVTAPAPADIAPFHDRAPPTLSLAQGLAWLDLEGPGKGMLEDLPGPGAYQVVEAPRDQLMTPEMRRLL
ncbi:MAG: SOS response-associated peptidase family protein [Phenylobacterium sp.]|uniref:SOS response-associated peptidase n=1 Tax=Phenylobacterium sp. TaxID=1871053 RepID=UPI0027354B52|nr:SOS response-associated peptidase family protein [Phenylobacterium sp.]MDP1640663.1 SOS response-associated peptidase family protein [Phenylobacterium sp.]MDP3116066.1 SOS response-associated peptidase family protein [Phenylobacterium sp.]